MSLGYILAIQRALYQTDTIGNACRYLLHNTLLSASHLYSVDTVVVKSVDNVVTTRVVAACIGGVAVSLDIKASTGMLHVPYAV